jgi:murein DD-endopeptidase MepM/ murein hydrolase activator NlpD
MSAKEFAALNGELANIRSGTAVKVLVWKPVFDVKIARSEIVKEQIPFRSVKIPSKSYPLGKSFCKRKGIPGEAEVTYNVTYVDGEEASRVAVSRQVITEPIDELIITGLKSKGYFAASGEGSTEIVNSRFIWPIAGHAGNITCRFGGGHRGLDIAAPAGTVVVASDAGTVIFSGWEGSYGKSVVIRHDNGSVTRYAHNSEILVRAGQFVSQSGAIAIVGRTGFATGVHLHFEVIANGVHKNPLRYIN